MNLGQVDLREKDILIVDDTPINLRVLAKILSDRGYKVRKALNGQLALTACENLLPDLILLDIMMPDLDGYQVCQQLKADAKTRDIPVIFISALEEEEDKVKAYQAGGADYIGKPFQLEEVLVRVRNQLTIQQLKSQVQQQQVQLQGLSDRLNGLTEELERFSDVVGTRLQPPLQAIVAHAEPLRKHYETQLSSDGDLAQIVEASQQLQQILKDLLPH